MSFTREGCRLLLCSRSRRRTRLLRKGTSRPVVLFPGPGGPASGQWLFSSPARPGPRLRRLKLAVMKASTVMDATKTETVIPSRGCDARSSCSASPPSTPTAPMRPLVMSAPMAERLVVQTRPGPGRGTAYADDEVFISHYMRSDLARLPRAMGSQNLRNPHRRNRSEDFVEDRPRHRSARRLSLRSGERSLLRVPTRSSGRAPSDCPTLRLQNGAGSMVRRNTSAPLAEAHGRRASTASKGLGWLVGGRRPVIFYIVLRDFLQEVRAGTARPPERAKLRRRADWLCVPRLERVQHDLDDHDDQGLGDTPGQMSAGHPPCSTWALSVSSARPGRPRRGRDDEAARTCSGIVVRPCPAMAARLAPSSSPCQSLARNCGQETGETETADDACERRLGEDVQVPGGPQTSSGGRSGATATYRRTYLAL